MAKKTLPYKEGDWFAVPLRDSGYGVGLVARMDGEGVVLGYFFGPCYDRLPTKEDISGLSATDAVLVRRFGDPGFLRREWPIIGESDSWSRELWPVPAFGRIALDRSKAWLTEYSDNDLTSPQREIAISVEEATGLPEDGLSGYGAIEIRLTRLLSS